MPNSVQNIDEDWEGATPITLDDDWEGGTPVTQTPEPPVIEKPKGKSVGSLISNYGTQVKDAVVGLNPFYMKDNPVLGRVPALHGPQDILAGIGSLGKGTLEALGRGNQGGPMSPEEQMARQLGSQLYQGGKQLVTHPIDWAYEHPLDASMVLSGGLGLLGKGAETAGLAKTASALKTAENITFPPKMLGLGRTYTQAEVDKRLVDDVNKLYDKAIKVPASVRQDPKLLERYRQSTADVVRAGFDLGDEIKFKDEYGTVVKGLKPKEMTTAKFSELVQQVKGAAYRQYDGLLKALNSKGLVVDTKPMIERIGKEYIDDFSRHFSEKEVEYIEEKLGKLETYKTGTLTLEEAQNYVRLLNDWAEPLARDTSEIAMRKKHFLGDLSREIRKQLDDTIETFTPNHSGPGWQEARNLYGSAKNIEQHVGRTAASRLGKDAADMDLYDVYTLSVAMGSVVAGNPAGLAKAATGSILKRVMEYEKNPDNIVRKMFENAEKTVGHSNYLKSKKPPLYTPSLTPEGGEPGAPKKLEGTSTLGIEYKGGYGTIHQPQTDQITPTPKYQRFLEGGRGGGYVGEYDRIVKRKRWNAQEAGTEVPTYQGEIVQPKQLGLAKLQISHTPTIHMGGPTLAEIPVEIPIERRLTGGRGGGFAEEADTRTLKTKIVPTDPLHKDFVGYDARAANVPITKVPARESMESLIRQEIKAIYPKETPKFYVNEKVNEILGRFGPLKRDLSLKEIKAFREMIRIELTEENSALMGKK